MLTICHRVSRHRPTLSSILCTLFTIHCSLFTLFLLSCTSHPSVPSNAKDARTLPAIYPDYCNVTVPCNIAPLNFMLSDETFDECVARITTPDGNSETYGDGRKVIIPESDWHDILVASCGKDIAVEVWGRKGDEWLAFKKFSITVSADSIDSYISYRLIEPSYLIYDYMEIAQRNLTNFEETQVFNNKVACDSEKGQCINCHSYQNYHTDNMLFHVRVTNGGTVIVNDGKAAKFDLKRENTISAGVYPAWHPTEKLIAFSTNSTRQLFHTVNINKTEVFDLASDLILYDVTKDEVSIVSADTTRLELFPAWSPDGKYLYYCATSADADSLANINYHTKYDKVRYNLYRRTFDIKTRQFGDEELIYDADSNGHSVSLPRVSPDGKHILFAEGAYGCFNIWHHDADIRLIAVPLADGSSPASASQTDESGQSDPLALLNTQNAAESYPTWSSNGKWIMCASRRDDGNYSRVYISYFDGKKARKAFLLPQRDPEHNSLRLKSYNRPEFMVEPIKLSVQDFQNVVNNK